MIPALEQDCRAEMPGQLLDSIYRIFCGREPALFEMPINAELEALRENAGSGIGRLLLDHALLVTERGKTGKEALIESLTNALTDRAAKCARQVEEHYLLKSTAPRSKHVRARIEEATDRAALGELSRRMLKIEHEPYVRPARRDGVDDGVPLI